MRNAQEEYAVLDKALSDMNFSASFLCSPILHAFDKHSDHMDEVEHGLLRRQRLCEIPAN